MEQDSVQVDSGPLKACAAHCKLALEIVIRCHPWQRMNGPQRIVSQHATQVSKLVSCQRHGRAFLTSKRRRRHIYGIGLPECVRMQRHLHFYRRSIT
jgi:hypothetical protein